MCGELRKGRTKLAGGDVKKVLRPLERLQVHSGNLEDERAAAASARLKAQAAALCFSQPLRDREPETCTRAVWRRVVRPIERLEHALALGLRYARPPVGDRNLQRVPNATRIDFNR